eukprot:2003486-Ditylum_brightwellii.AAC.1
MERASTRSLEVVTETVQAGNEETIEGNRAESGCQLYFYSGAFHRVPQNWIFPTCSLLVMLQHCFLTDRVQKVSLLQHLSVADVKHIKHGRQNLAKMWLVANKIT